MAWYSHKLAFAIVDDPANATVDPRGLLDGPERDGDRFVYAPSRNGCMIGWLERICALAVNGKDLYLLADVCLLRRDAVPQALAQIEALLDELARNPSLVVEATKDPHTPHITLHTEGFEPLAAELVYGPDVVIKDGWVYNYTEAQVSDWLTQSCASPTPCPETDDDGESLLYVFNFLRSHVALLQWAAASGLVVVYGEMNT